MESAATVLHAADAGAVTLPAMPVTVLMTTANASTRAGTAVQEAALRLKATAASAQTAAVQPTRLTLAPDMFAQEVMKLPALVQPDLGPATATAGAEDMNMLAMDQAPAAITLVTHTTILAADIFVPAAMKAA